ncbi:isoprenylcysteine carboxylmethyltransferase family protein [Pseudalkalibacillus hwajinpoensis]|uniref:methyltransferase family protein n=1 Tax=Guptibacillus hwajinpoensis TaxID=208199 RepID=UPI00325A74FD
MLILLGISLSIRNVIVESKLDVVSTGPYRILRHPLYTGLLLSLVGIPLYFGTWVGILISILLLTPILLYRIGVEERMLVESIGDYYREWGKERYRLIPFVY